MKFFFPDAQDYIDPGFDFEKDKYSRGRVRGRTDQYVHEVFPEPVQDGILISKVLVTGYTEPDPPGSPPRDPRFKKVHGRKYSIAQARRLLDTHAPEFFHLSKAPKRLEIMGDCGAFSYRNLERPPFSCEEVLQFYEDCHCDLGISVDHLIFEMDPELDLPGATAAPELRERQQLTLSLAEEFLSLAGSPGHRRDVRVHPVGVAQGWSPNSYRDAVVALQKMGYDYVALGGLVPADTGDILKCLEAIKSKLKPTTRLHLLGVTRPEALARFAQLGVASFDSTSPLQQAFKDKRNNYYLLEGSLTAVRIPPLDENNAVRKLIRSGAVSQDEARRLEKACLKGVEEFLAGKEELEPVVSRIVEYEQLALPRKPKKSAAAKKTARPPSHSTKAKKAGNSETYRKVLQAKPWLNCPCALCQTAKHHIILFRGAERNRRRGFHNVWVFYRRLQRELGKRVGAAA